MKRIISTLISTIFSLCVILCINSNSFADIEEDNSFSNNYPKEGTTGIAPQLANGVEADGSFSYSYPIEVPPGTAGMAPQLAIVYNSNSDKGIPGANSPLGAGFDLAGLGCITRDTTHPIVYKNDANFYMLQTNRYFQGERLVYIWTGYGEFAHSYHFENESFSRIERFDRQGDGPSYWIETKPDGTKYYYGYTDGDYSDTNSKIWALKSNGTQIVDCDGFACADPQACIRTWALSKIEDTYGNCIKIIYDQDNGDYYPLEIRYTENTGFPISGYRSIEFGYDETSRQDYYNNNPYGSKIETRYLLNKITIKVDGDEVYNIDLIYDPGDTLTKSRLTSFINSGNENNTVSLKWHYGNDEASEWNTTAGDAYKPPISIYPGIQSDLVDIDGDGLLDCVQAYKDINGTTRKKTFLNRIPINGTWVEMTGSNYLLPGLFKDATQDKKYWIQLVDINGDALTDCLIDQNVYLNTGNGWSSTPYTAYKLPIAIYPGIQSDLVDIDGDGLLDCVQAYKDINGTTIKKTFLNRIPINGTWVEMTGSNYLLPGLFKDAIQDKKYWIQLVDINGDALTDCLIDQDVYLNTGNGWSSTPKSAYKLPIAIYPGIQSNLMDVNGDGYYDCVRAFKDVNGILQKKTYLYLNNSWIETTNNSYIFPGLFKDAKENIIYATKLVDLNGDGLTDYTINNSINTDIDTRLRTGITKNHLLTEIIDSFGAKTKVSYTPAAQFVDKINDGFTDRPIDPAGSQWPYIYNSSARYLVDSIKTTTYDNSATYTKLYSYKKGKVYAGYPYQRKNLYFQCVTEQDETGQYTKTYYKQGTGTDDHYYAGKISMVNYYDSNRSLKKSVQYNYNPVENPFDPHRPELVSPPGIALVKMQSIVETTYEDGQSVFINTKTFNSYDSYGNPTQITEHSSDTSLPDIVTTISYAVDTNAWVLNLPGEIKTTVNGTSQKLQRFTYNANKKLEIKQDWVYNPVDATTKWINTWFDYDNYGNVRRITSPNAVGGTSTTTITYDSEYQTFPISVADAIGKRNFEYDPATGNKTSETDYNGNKTNYLYDPIYKNRLVELYKPALGWTKKIRYMNWTDATNRYIETHSRKDSSGGYTFEREYIDSLYRKYKTVSTGAPGYNLVKTYEYDAFGRLWKESNTYAENCDTPYYTTITYDSAGRVNFKTYADGTRESWWYSFSKETSTSGLWKRVTFVNKNGELQYTFHDSRGNLRRKKDYGEGYINYGYDAMGRLTSTQNSAGNNTTITYDTLGRKTRLTDPNAGTTFYTYYDSGHLAKQTDARGITLRYAYDNANRVIEEMSSDDTINTYYYYDTGTGQNLAGRLASVIDNNGETTVETTFSYSPVGNVSQYVKSIKDGEGTDTKEFAVGMTYDYQDRLVSTTYPDPDHTVVLKQYADAGYLAAVTNANNEAYVQYTRESCSVNEVERITGNGVKTVISYDPRNLRPITILTTNSTGTIENIKYYHDNTGNITKLEDLYYQSAPTVKTTDDTESFTYDPIGRLIGATTNGLYGTKIYRYSTDGNLATKDNNTLTYGNPNHPHAVTAYSGNIYAYDEAGNMTSRKGKTLVYDAKNRLIEVKDGNAITEKYTYDFTGFRVKKEIFNTFGVAETTVYNINGIYELKRTAGNSTYEYTKYIYGINNEIVAQLSGTTTSLGSIFPVTKDMYNWKNLKGFLLKIYACAYAFFENPNGARYVSIFVLSIAALFLLGLWIFNTFIRQEGFILTYKWMAHAIPMIILIFFMTFGLAGCSDSGSGGSGGSGSGYPFNNIVVNGIYYFHPNHVGSVKFITNDSGAVIADYRYLPYGELVLTHSSGTDISKYKYTAQEEDSTTGLYYYNARFYDPEIGRFITPDSTIPDPTNTQAFNRYMYANGNPVRYNDPTGYDTATSAEGLVALYGMAAMPIAASAPTSGALVPILITGIVITGKRAAPDTQPASGGYSSPTTQPEDTARSILQPEKPMFGGGNPGLGTMTPPYGLVENRGTHTMSIVNQKGDIVMSWNNFYNNVAYPNSSTVNQGDSGSYAPNGTFQLGPPIFTGNPDENGPMGLLFIQMFISSRTTSTNIGIHDGRANIGPNARTAGCIRGSLMSMIQLSIMVSALNITQITIQGPYAPVNDKGR